jgi:hypothetical protein
VPEKPALRRPHPYIRVRDPEVAGLRTPKEFAWTLDFSV